MTTQQEQKAQEAASRLLALWAAYQAGKISLPDFREQGARIVYAGKIAASRLADIAVSMLAQRPALGITPGTQHLERLAVALETITAEESPTENLLEAPEADSVALSGIPAQLQRLAIAESLASHQLTTRAAITEHGFPRFREKVAANACEVCQPFRDAEHDSEEDWSPHHPGCRCELIPDGQPEQETSEREEPSPLIRITREVVVR